MKLSMIPEMFSVCRLEPDSALPSWLNYTGYSFVARTPDELSIICPEGMSASVANAEKGWRCIRNESRTEASVRAFRVGVALPLMEAGLSTLVLSTSGADYLLFRDADFPRTERILAAAGHQIER